MSETILYDFTHTLSFIDITKVVKNPHIRKYMGLNYVNEINFYV